MTYAVRADLEARFGAGEIGDLAPVDGAPDRTVAALADAAAEIDSDLAERFALPLAAGPWPLLTGIACDLARERLYDDAPPDRVTAAAASARTRLGDLVSGERRLVDADGAEAPRLASVRTAGPEPAFSRDALRDY